MYQATLNEAHLRSIRGFEHCSEQVGAPGIAEKACLHPVHDMGERQPPIEHVDNLRPTSPSLNDDALGVAVAEGMTWGVVGYRDDGAVVGVSQLVAIVP